MHCAPDGNTLGTQVGRAGAVSEVAAANHSRNRMPRSFTRLRSMRNDAQGLQPFHLRMIFG